MTDRPKMPEPAYRLSLLNGLLVAAMPGSAMYKKAHGENVFTASQLQSYADEAVAAERERCAKLCEDMDYGFDLAAAIRKAPQ